MMQFNSRTFNGNITRLIFLAGLLISALPGLTQTELKFVAVVSEKNVALRQPFQVQFVVYGAKYVPDIKIPSIRGFVVNDTFTNQASQVISGKTLQWIDSYSKVLVLTPMKTGRFTIPAASVTINGKKLTTKAIKITVSQTGLTSVPEPDNEENEPVVADESELRPGEKVEEKIRNNFFLRANTNKTSCYVGEPLAVAYKAYSRLNSNSQVVKRPSFPGFSVVEMVGSYDNKPEVEVIKGNAFYTNLIRKVQLFPLQAGKYELDPAEIESVVHFVKTENTKNDGKSQLQRLLDRSVSFRSNFEHYTTLKTTPVTIDVKPLPEKDQPADFTGAVGNFALQTVMPADKIRQGELVKIQWVLSGSGNLQLVTLPDIEWPKGIDTSEPSVKEELNQFVYPLSGKKTFDYAVTARDTGNYTIPPISFSYFDPETEVYKTLVTAPISFHVTASEKTIFADTDTVKSLADRPLHLYWFGGVALVIIGWITYQLLFLNKRPKEPVISVEAVKPIPVTAITSKEVIPAAAMFGNARKSLINDDIKGFYREVQRVLWKIAAERCEVLPSFLNKQNISFQLQKQDIAAPVITSFTAVLNECEWALYTPDHSPSDMQELLEKAVEISEKLKS
ncbi:MAG: protein BatD [Chitinophagaceae bacterium]|nr:MAG: protein BatD [Chitinophagaceae bacterium]